MKFTDLKTTCVCEEVAGMDEIYILFFFYFIIPFRNFGPPYLGKATAAARASAIPSPTSAYRVFSMFL